MFLTDDKRQNEACQLQKAKFLQSGAGQSGRNRISEEREAISGE